MLKFNTPYNNTSVPKTGAKPKGKTGLSLGHQVKKSKQDAKLKLTPPSECPLWEPEIDPKIDKITLTINQFTEEAKKQTFEVLKTQAEGGGGADLGKMKNGYSNNFRFKLDANSETFLVSIYPYNSTKYAFARVEFNPSHIGKAGVEELLYGWFEFLFPDGVASIYEHARVSRLDFAVDIVGLDIKDLMVISNYNVRSTVFASDGFPESIYLGAPGSKNQWRIYNKLSQLHHLGKEFSAAHQITRVERVLRNVGMFRNLHKMKNPLRSLQLGRYDTPIEEVPDWQWAQFCAHARETTPQAALARTPKEWRELFL